jgi:hypothetical protein
MPPPAFFFGTSATMASVVIRRAATEAAFWIPTRTTLVIHAILAFLHFDFGRAANADHRDTAVKLRLRAETMKSNRTSTPRGGRI